MIGHEREELLDLRSEVARLRIDLAKAHAHVKALTRDRDGLEVTISWMREQITPPDEDPKCS